MYIHTYIECRLGPGGIPHRSSVQTAMAVGCRPQGAPPRVLRGSSEGLVLDDDNDSNDIMMDANDDNHGTQQHPAKLDAACMQTSLL